MTQSEVDVRSRTASNERDDHQPNVPVVPPPPASRASIPVIDDLEPYNLPFTD